MSRSPKTSTRHRRALAAAAALLSSLASACASTGATFRSGVGDAWLEHPPYYAGRSTAGEPAGGVPTGHLPVVWQRGGGQAPVFDPSVGPALNALLAEMTAFVDALGSSVRLVEGGRVSAVAHADTRVPPDVRFGCETDSGLPDDDCADRGDGVLGREGQTMKLSVGRPSEEWIAWNREVVADVGVERTLVITLEVGHYLTRQRGLRGTKEVELGTAHVARLPWLTSLETPVSVVQLTGALVDPDGRVIRVGAEGLLARRTSLPISALGAQALITDQEIEALRTARREDLPGEPLAWQVGLRVLVERLTGRAAAPVAP